MLDCNLISHPILTPISDTVCFPRSRVPARVVVTFTARTLYDLEPSLRASVDSWRIDSQRVAPSIVYYNDAQAREFLALHFADEKAVDAWDILVPGAYKADLFRACEIFVNGGLYCDVKCTRIAPYAALVGERGTVALEHSGLGLWNGCFAAPPKAPWVGAYVRRILANVKERSYGMNLLDITGPVAMGRSFRSFAGFSDASASCEFLRSRNDWQGIRILAMRVPDTDFFDVVSSESTRSSVQPAFERRNPHYLKSRRGDDPVSSYTYAYKHRRVYHFKSRSEANSEAQREAQL